MLLRWSTNFSLRIILCLKLETRLCLSVLGENRDLNLDFTRLANSVNPVERSSVQMGDRENYDVVLIDGKIIP